jgi:hypothetical protein
MPDTTDPPVTEETREELAPGYETDPAAVGTNRKAIDPDPRPWYEVHGLTEAEAEAMTDAPS